MVLHLWSSLQNLSFSYSLTHARYGVLLAQRDVNLSDKEQVISLLEFMGAEDTQYQLGLNKVQQHAAFLVGQAHISIV